MALRFTDRRGSSGTVTDELEVRYDGPWREVVEERVQHFERECRTGGEVDLEAALRELLLDLPEHVPVTEVRRRDVWD